MDMVHDGSCEATPFGTLLFFWIGMHQDHVEFLDLTQCVSELETLNIHWAFDSILVLFLIVNHLFIILGDDGYDEIQQNYLDKETVYDPNYP